MKTLLSRSWVVKWFLTALMVLGITFMGTANAILIDRGGGLIFDTDLGITWLEDTNVVGFGMTWDDAIAWADAFVYQGYDDWRLPTSPATTQGFINEGEMGHLYYTTLGNPAGGPLTHTGPFVNFPPTEVFWLSATPLHPGSAWNFEFYRGFQNASSSDFNSWYAWPVREGDSAPVPEPATWLLFATGLVGLLAYRWRKRTAV